MTSCIEYTTATPLEMLLLADEASDAGAWEEASWLRLRAAYGPGYGHGGVQAMIHNGAMSLRTSEWCWYQWTIGPKWYWHAGDTTYLSDDVSQPPPWIRRLPPPEIRRLLENAAEEAVYHVLTTSEEVP